MNNYILSLIDEAINGEKESNVDKLYRIFWISALEQFKLNPINNEIVLWVKEKGNDYYKLVYYCNSKFTELLFKMSKEDCQNLKQMLIDDGYIFNGTMISISRKTIIDFTKPKNQYNETTEHKLTKC